MKRRLLAGLVLIICLAGLSVAIRAIAKDGGTSGVVLHGVPYAVAVNPAVSRAYILAITKNSQSQQATLTTIDTGSGTRVAAVNLPVTAAVPNFDSLGGQLNSGDPYDLAIDPAGDLLFVVDTATNSVHVLDARTGRLLHTVATGSLQTNAPRIAIDSPMDRVFIAGMPGTMLDGHTGALLGHMPGSDRVVLDGHGRHAVFIDSINQLIHVVDARSGALVASTALGFIPFNVLPDPSTGHIFVSGDGILATLDAATGRLLHTVSVSGIANNGVVDPVTGHAFFINPASFSLLTLDTRRGTLIGSAPVGQFLYPPVVDPGSGHVYMADPPNNSVRVYDARSGRYLGSVFAGAYPDVLSVDPAHGLLYALNHRLPIDPGHGLLPGNAVTVLHTRTGAVASTLGTDTLPLEFGVDERRGQLIVASTSGLAPAPDPLSWIPGWLRFLLPGGRTNAHLHSVGAQVQLYSAR